MKKAILAVAVVALALPIFAQGKKTEKKTEIACPIMPDHKVNIKKATKSKMFADHEGKRYFFCCAGCVPKFKEDPNKYKDAESIPTPKKKK
jgi:YHS domain-containing protein